MEVNTLKIVFLFSGQGSQFSGMGESLFEHNATFKNCVEQSDAVIRKRLNRSLIDELYAAKEQPFDDLLMTHPGIVAVEIAIYRVLQEMGITPDYVCGSSLGEFAAGVVNGVWTAQMAIEASIEQAKSIVRNSSSGGMLAVMNKRGKDMQYLYSKHKLYVAADNFDGHFTLAGPAQSINACQYELSHMGIPFQRLPVNYAFHSPMIEGELEFAYYMAATPFLSNPKAGFISGIKCKESNSLHGNYFWDVVTRYIDFKKIIHYIECRGPCLYVDLGPSGSAANFVKYNLSPVSRSQTFQIMTPFKREREQLKALQKMIELQSHTIPSSVSIYPE